MMLREIDRAAMQEACRLAGTNDVSVWTMEEPEGKTVRLHRHSCAQLTTAYGGSIKIHTADNSWTISAGLCLWLPEDTDHEIEIRRATRLQIAYIHRQERDGHLESCCPLLTSRLLHELFATATRAGETAWTNARMQLVFRLMLDEIRLAPSVAKHMPIPRREDIRAICDDVTANPARPAPQKEYAYRLGTSPHHFNRVFQRETGLTFAAWCSRLRVLLALQYLAQGLSIGAAANELGYASTKALGAAFTRVLGQSPQTCIPALHRTKPASRPEP